MELDPRLQNISAADLQDFSVSHYPGFAPAYQSAVYANGLNNDHAAQAHAQAYAQFVPDATTGQPHFEPANTSPSQRRVNNPALVRGQGAALQQANANAQNVHTTPTNARQAPHSISQHQPSAQYGNNLFASPTSTISPANPLRHTSSTSSPHLQSLPHSHSHSHTHPHLHPQAHQPNQKVPPSQSQSDPSQFNHPSTFPLVPNPPNLAVWREKFFNITTPLLLTSEEYHTYFPHVDNIYSHRSTQKYKKKPFVSHYWDCRLKGRPTGTPLSKLRKRKEEAERERNGEIVIREEDDKDKDADEGQDGDKDGDGKEVKKRKRKTRERDLCDVKIKVTEFFGRDELEAMGKLNLGDDVFDDLGVGMGMGTGIGLIGSGINGGATSTGAGAAATSPATGRMSSAASVNGQLTFVLEDGTSAGLSNPSAVGSTNNTLGRMSLGGGGNVNNTGAQVDDSMTFGVLEPMKKFPEGHPGADGKRWYMVQRVNGNGKDGDDAGLDHKHTMEESDRIKKNSVQRWLIAQEKERKKQNQRNKTNGEQDGNTSLSRNASISLTPSFHASGKAQQTAKSRAPPASTQLTFFANSFCPFAQRIWIALEMKGIPYQYVEVTPSVLVDGKCTIPAVLEVCPDGITPLLRHGNWAVWESDVVLEYLEDLSMGHSLLPLGDPQLRAHCRLWKDHINRKILPYFYALLLLPIADEIQSDGQPVKPTVAERQTLLVSTLQRQIIHLVNASHATGPFFLGSEISFVDVAFAPWIIRLSRVMEYYREFPKPEVGTRWKVWVDAVENHDAVRRTVSDEKSYHGVYGGIGKDGWDINHPASQVKKFSEIRYAERVVRSEGFGLGGDIWGKIGPEPCP